MSVFSFDERAIQVAEEDFSKITLTPDLRNTIYGVAKSYCQYINISEIAMRGFILKGIKSAQKELKVDLQDAIAMGGKVYQEFDAKVLDCITKALIRVTRDPSDEAKRQLHKLSKQASDYAKQMLQ